jgi:hypothetical protein
MDTQLGNEPLPTQFQKKCWGPLLNQSENALLKISKNGKNIILPSKIK